MKRSPTNRRRPNNRLAARPINRLAALLTAALLAATACSAASATSGKAPARVLYAGSLVNLMEHSIGPAFTKATGYPFDGYGAGSTALANEIKSQVRRGDVFISASPAVDTTLQGNANGNWVTSYTPFATAPLVLGYNPGSRFAAALRTMPWYDALLLPGIRIGRTDPALDPKGRLTVTALTTAQATLHKPNFATTVEHRAAVFPEEELVGRLESGQLDAGFFYTSEAVPQHIPTAPLTPLHLAAHYTVAILAHAPDPAAAAAFLSFLTTPTARTLLSTAGLTP